MDLDFESFLKKSLENCKTKEDFIKKISDERKSLNDISLNFNPLEKGLYLSRLENAKFGTEKGAFKLRDKYNPLIIKVLVKLK
jgi:hypothetical protein